MLLLYERLAESEDVMVVRERGTLPVPYGAGGGRRRPPVYLTNDLAQLDQLHGTPVERCALIHGVVTALPSQLRRNGVMPFYGMIAGDEEPAERNLQPSLVVLMHSPYALNP